MDIDKVIKENEAQRLRYQESCANSPMAAGSPPGVAQPPTVASLINQQAKLLTIAEERVAQLENYISIFANRKTPERGNDKDSGLGAHMLNQLVQHEKGINALINRLDWSIDVLTGTLGELK